MQDYMIFIIYLYSKSSILYKWNINNAKWADFILLIKLWIKSNYILIIK